MRVGSAFNITGRISDKNGHDDVWLTEIRVSTRFTHAPRCIVRYNHNSSQLILFDDATKTWNSAGEPGRGEQIENSNCTLDAASSSVSIVNPMTVDVSITVTFTTEIEGQKNIWLRGFDDSAHWGTQVDLGDIHITSDETPPSVPMSLEATAGGKAVALDWDDGTESDIDGYNVYRSTTESGPYTAINDELVRESGYVDATTDNDTTYYFVVTAVDESGNESGRSNVENATPRTDVTPPSAPTGFGSTARDSAVYLDWDDGAEFDLAGHNIWRATMPDGDYSQINGEPVVTGNYLDETSTNDVTYDYAVVAVDFSGNESPRSTTTRVTPRSWAGFDSISSAAIAHFESQFDTLAEEAHRLRTFDVRALAWDGNKRLKSLLAMYQGTEERKYLDLFVTYADIILSQRDDRIDPQPVDVHRQRVLAAWGTAGFSNTDGHYVSLVHNGIITFPLAQFVHLIETTPELASYAAKSNEYLSDIRETVAEFDLDFFERPDGTGNYTDGFDGQVLRAPLPMNMQLAMGSTHIVLWQITRDAAYLNKATRLARLLRNELVDDDNAYTWTYRPSEGRVEDISHGHLVIEFAVAAAAAEIEFDATDLAKFSERLKRMAKPRTVDGFWNYLDLTDHSPLNEGLTSDLSATVGGWGQLGATDPEVRRAIYGYFAANDWEGFELTDASIVAAAYLVASQPRIDLRNAGILDLDLDLDVDVDDNELTAPANSQPTFRLMQMESKLRTWQSRI